MIIKICGLNRPGDVDACAEAGAQMVGFNLWPKSPRYVEIETAQALARAAKDAGLETVALLVEPDRAMLERVDRDPLFDWVQPYRLPDGLHPHQSSWLEPRPVTERIPPLHSDAHRLLIETAVPGHGGSGKRFDWGLLRDQRGIDEVMIAGGIRPDNVAELLGIARPWGIDVASGVESRPGLKDHGKIRTLIGTVRDFLSDSSSIR